MKHKGIFHYIVFALALLLAACGSTEKISTPPADRYTAAAEALAEGDFTMELTTNRVISHGEDRLRRSVSQEIGFHGYNSKTPDFSSQMEFRIGEKTVTATETFRDNTLYLELNGSCFKQEMEAASAFSRCAPAKLLDPQRYSGVEAVTEKGKTVISFFDPKEGEPWAVPAGAALLDAAGTAILQEDGTLHQSSYSVTYREGDVTVTLQVTARYRPGAKEVALSQLHRDAPEVQNVDAVLLLETACLELLEQPLIHASYTAATGCGAGDLHRTQQTQLLWDRREGFQVTLDTGVTLDSGSGVSSFQQAEAFRDDEYTISLNGQPAVTDRAVTQEEMTRYCSDLLVESVVLPEHITAASILEAGDRYRLEFTGSQALADLLGEKAYTALYDGQALLPGLETREITCWVELDLRTGLLLSSGMYYAGEDAAAALPYFVTCSLNQVYSYETGA